MKRESISARMRRIIQEGAGPADTRRWAQDLVTSAENLLEHARNGDEDQATDQLSAIIPLVRQLAKALGQDDLHRALLTAGMPSGRI